jgi:hypothetical protein
MELDMVSRITMNTIYSLPRPELPPAPVNIPRTSNAWRHHRRNQRGKRRNAWGDYETVLAIIAGRAQHAGTRTICDDSIPGVNDSFITNPTCSVRMWIMGKPATGC